MKKYFAVITALAIFSGSVFLSSCNKKNTDNSSSTSQSAKISTGQNSDKQVSIKNYTFPEFLKNEKSREIPVNSVYESFNKTEFVKKCKGNEFDNYQTVNCFGGSYYSYSDGGYMGLLNSGGEILFSAESYTNIDAVANSVLEFSDNEEHKAYVLLTPDGSASVTYNEIFNGDNAQIITAGENGSKFKIMFSGGYFVTYQDSEMWDTAEEIETDKLNTKKEFSKCFKVSRKDKKYYVCFDNFGNYSIYNTEYAHISLKVGNDSGECYVQNPDDYKQLNSLMENFGQLDFTTVPKKDENSDYIQITFGLDGKDKKNVTVSPTGLCFTEKKNADGKGISRYFSCIDKECFASLVEWVEKVIPKEYAE